ncbi:hypothetical protein V8G54_036939 [Vigna mungo]|uniref:Uncharacterized protein n=1 Tax=Vigna mungo TaxID=3915 RepID=A0AAQ3MIF8_VIGMU
MSTLLYSLWIDLIISVQHQVFRLNRKLLLKVITVVGSRIRSHPLNPVLSAHSMILSTVIARCFSSRIFIQIWERVPSRNMIGITVVRLPLFYILTGFLILFILEIRFMQGAKISSFHMQILGIQFSIMRIISRAKIVFFCSRDFWRIHKRRIRYRKWFISWIFSLTLKGPWRKRIKFYTK